MEFNNYMSLQLHSISVQTYFITHPRTTQICFPISQIQCFLGTEELWKWKSTCGDGSVLYLDLGEWDLERLAEKGDHEH